MNDTPDMHHRHRLTCDICDTPAACIRGECHCDLTGTFIAGPHQGKSIVDIAAAEQGRDDMQEFAPGPGGHDDDDPLPATGAGAAPTEQMDLVIVWPMSTPELTEQAPLFATMCDQVLRYLAGSSGDVNSPEAGARSAKLVDAAIAAFEVIQDAVEELTPSGKISTTGVAAGTALVMAFGLARQCHLAGIRQPNLRAAIASMMGSYTLLLAHPLANQMMGEPEVEDGEGNQPPPAADPVALDLARRMANSRR